MEECGCYAEGIGVLELEFLCATSVFFVLLWWITSGIGSTTRDTENTKAAQRSILTGLLVPPDYCPL